MIEALIPVLGNVLQGQNGGGLKLPSLFSSPSARSSSSSSSSVNVAVNPSIANVQGGYANPTSGGYASGSASSSADASGSDYGYLPNAGGYGLGSTRAIPATYDSLDIARTQPGIFSSLGQEQILLLLAAAAAAFYFMTAKG